MAEQPRTGLDGVAPAGAVGATSGAPADEDVTTWLRAGVLGGSAAYGPTSDGWTLRVKPDRRQLQLPVAAGDDRRVRQ